MRRILIAAFLAAVVATVLSAQELTVSYVEGKAEVKSGQSWREIGIGDQVSSNSVIRLEGQAYLEMTAGSQSVSLSQPGTYGISGLLADSQQMSSAGVGPALSARLVALFGAPQEQSTTMGIRADNAAAKNGVSWMMSDSQVYIDSGKEYVKSGDYKKAIAEFKQAVDSASGSEVAEAHYYLGYAYSLAGNTRAALKELNGVSPSDLVAGAADLVVLKGKLLLDTSAFEQDVRWLASNEGLIGKNSDRSPAFHLLLGLSYKGVGETAKAKASLEEVVSTAGSSELGKAAAKVLTGM